MVTLTCDWCLIRLRVPDGTTHTPDNIICCSDRCGEEEYRFRMIMSDANITNYNSDGNWLKEMVGWTKPANGD